MPGRDRVSPTTPRGARTGAAPTLDQLDTVVRGIGYAPQGMAWRSSRLAGWMETASVLSFSAALAARDAAIAAGWDAGADRGSNGRWSLSIGPREDRRPVIRSDVDRTEDELEVLGTDPSEYVRLRWHVIRTIADCRRADLVDPATSLRSVECALIRAHLGTPDVRLDVISTLERAVLTVLRGESVDAVTLLPAVREFPILRCGNEVAAFPGGRRSVPWDWIVPHKEQVRRNHGGQDLDRLADGGGLSPAELWCVVHGKPWSMVLRRDVTSEQAERWLAAWDGATARASE